MISNGGEDSVRAPAPVRTSITFAVSTNTSNLPCAPEFQVFSEVFSEVYSEVYSEIFF